MEPQLVLVLGATSGVLDMLAARLAGLNVRLRYAGWRVPAMARLQEARPAAILINSAMVGSEERAGVMRYLAAAAALDIPVIDFRYLPPDAPRSWRGIGSPPPPGDDRPGMSGARSPLRPLLPTQDAGTAIDPSEAARLSEPPHGLAFA